jgi:hypothetical protein
MIVHLAPLKRLGEFGDALSETSLAEIGNLLDRDLVSRNQHADHRLAGYAEHVTDDIADLDVGRLQHFLDAVFFCRKIALQLLARPRQVSQLDLCARRQKASFQQSMPVQMG